MRLFLWWAVPLGAVLLGALLPASAARAAPVPNLELAPCPGLLDLEDVRRLLRVEIEREWRRSGEPALPASAGLRCEGNKAILQATDHRSGRTLTRTLDIGRSPPSVRSRLVTLNLAELIAAVRAGREERSFVSTVPPPAAPKPRSSHREAAKTGAPRSPLGVRGAASVEGSGSPVLALWGATLGAEVMPSRRLSWLKLLTYVDYHLGQRAVELGQARVQQLALGIVTLYQRCGGAWCVSGGPGVRAAYVQVEGVPHAAVRRRGLTRHLLGWAPLVVARVHRKLARSWQLYAGLRGGWTVGRIEATLDGVPVQALDGLWFGGEVGVCLEL